MTLSCPSTRTKEELLERKIKNCQEYAKILIGRFTEEELRQMSGIPLDMVKRARKELGL